MCNQQTSTLGIDIGGTSVKLGVVQPGTGIVWRKQLPFEKIDPIQMLEKIADAARQSLKEYPISSVGVSTAGKVDPRKGTTQADNLKWFDVPVRDTLAGMIGLPVAIDNDAQCALIAEWTDGACASAQNVAYLTYGTGIGGAMIINGQPYRGRMNSGGEMGHIIIHGGGRKCSCGHRGCYEAYASTAALKRMMNGRHSVRQIVDGARAGDARFVRVFDQYIEEVALGLIGVMAVLSPDYVVLGGGLSNAGEFFLNKVQQRMDRCEPWLTTPTQIVLAKYGNDAGILGAAALAGLHFTND